MRINRNIFYMHAWPSQNKAMHESRQRKVLTYKGLTSAGKPKFVFTKIAGGHVLSRCPKERHPPPGTLNFNIFSGGDGLSLGHLH
jgi:hypothetical protein